MNRQRTQGHLKRMVGAFREGWGKLIGDQTMQIRGERDKLSGRMQVENGSTRETGRRAS